MSSGMDPTLPQSLLLGRRSGAHLRTSIVSMHGVSTHFGTVVENGNTVAVAE